MKHELMTRFGFLWKSEQARVTASVQLHDRLGSARDEARKRVEGHFGEAVEGELVHLVEREVHEAREIAFDSDVAADQGPHQIADGAVFSERDEGAEVAVAEGAERLARQATLEHAHEMRGLLM